MSLSLASQFTQKNYSWTNWKTIQISKKLTTQYDDDRTLYTIYGYDGPEVHTCNIFKGIVPYSVIDNGYSQAQNDSDKSDFEINYLPSANQSIYLNSKMVDGVGKTLTSTNQGSKQYLDTISVPIGYFSSTYLATNTFATALLSTDIFTIIGSATKTIKIVSIGISATQSTQSIVNLTLLKRSTDNIGGTSTILTNVPLDSTNAVSTASIKSYTANPTVLGTLIGNTHRTKFLIPTILVGATATAQTEMLYEFGEGSGQTLTLRGISELFAINLNATTIAGNSFSIWIKWTEE